MRPMGPYFAAFLALGVALSFFGPALPTLRDQTGATLGQLGLVVALGALMGLGAGAMDVSANTVAPTLVEPADLVASMNALHMCFAIGALATPLVVGLSVAITDGLGLACIVFGFVLVGL